MQSSTLRYAAPNSAQGVSLRSKIPGPTKEIAIFPEGGIVPPLARVLFFPLPYYS